MQQGGSWIFCHHLLSQGQSGLWEARAAAPAEDERQVLQFKSTGQTQSSSLRSFTLLKLYMGKAVFLKPRAVSQSQAWQGQGSKSCKRLSNLFLKS